MNSTTLYMLTPLAIGMAMALGFWQMQLPPTQSEQLHDRLVRSNVAMFTGDVDELELQKPFAERALFPIVNRLGRLMARRTKESQLAVLRVKLQRAGSKQRPETLLAMQVVLPVVAAAAAFGLTILLAWTPPLNALVIVGAVFLGYSWPVGSLSSKTKKRAASIRLDLPGALDLLGVAMEAGLSMDAAMMKISEGGDSVLTQEFAKVLGEVHLGRVRSEALMAMAERNDVDELTGFVRSIVQAEPLGVSLAVVLAVQADELRRIRRQRAEEAGHRAPVLMLLPMMGCIFPCIFIILLGPAALKVFSGS